MSADLGKDDVVEAVRDLVGEVAGHRIEVRRGDRATVVRVRSSTWLICPCDGPFGLVLQEYPLPEAYGSTWQWCACGWRKVGGSQADTVRRFVEELNRAPVLEPVE
jgi:hypothetical protein